MQEKEFSAGNPEKRREELIFTLPSRVIVPSEDIYTISGLAGTGKSTVADMTVGEKVKKHTPIIEPLTGMRVWKVGQGVRKSVRSKTGSPLSAYFEVEDLTEDLSLDELQEERIRNARGKPPLEIEGRLSGLIGASVTEELQGKRNAPKITRVLFICSDEEERLLRVYKREKTANPNMDMTFEQVKEDTLRRDKELNYRFATLYPNLLTEGDNPYRPDITTIHGTPVYDIVIDTAGISLEETHKLFTERLLEEGAARTVTRKDFGAGEIGDQAYSLIVKATACETEVFGRHCSRISTKTLDLYVGDKSVGSIPVCSRDHFRWMKSAVRLAGLGKDVRFDFGRNGFERNPREIHSDNPLHNYLSI